MNAKPRWGKQYRQTPNRMNKRWEGLPFGGVYYGYIIGKRVAVVARLKGETRWSMDSPREATHWNDMIPLQAKTLSQAKLMVEAAVRLLGLGQP